MARVNVYLPDDLAETVRERELPVSAICQRALREELDRMTAAAATTTGDLESIAARLRLTRSEEAEIKYKEGIECGANWARTTATASELEEFASAFPFSIGGNMLLSPNEHTLPEHLYAWLETNGRGHLSLDGADAFDRGLVAGAHEVWTAVKPLL